MYVGVGTKFLATVYLIFLNFLVILATKYPFLNSLCSNFFYYMKSVTSLTNTVKVTTWPLFPMLAAILLVSIATWNLLHYFKPAFDFPHSGFAVQLCILYLTLPHFITQQLALFNNPSNRNITPLWKISDAHRGKQACYILVGCHVCYVSANISENPAGSIFYSEDFSEGCTPIHHDSRKWSAF
jgi:hypothetical protein